MFCPRCNDKIELILEENFIEYGKTYVKSKKEYFCSKCTCVLIEHFNGFDFLGSDWIDFNG